ncbi:MAG: 2-hydroxyacyl-CoA dehydratase [Pirellulales bacterium]|nr:2-hydroxyacyl-CoA dehydratase [Pirellulales bacterium]
MNDVAYLSPFVPPEWIAAHGLRPRWLRLSRAEQATDAGAHRGVCPCAGALMERVHRAGDLAGVVLTTVCDQMRYAAAWLDAQSGPPVFLLNVPSTWESPETARLYADELRRLGRFLVKLGGHAPTEKEVVATLRRYDQARAALRAECLSVSARDYALVLDRLAGHAPSPPAPLPKGEGRNAIPLALLGGPLLEEDFELLDMVVEAGGRIVLDASQGGERTLPAVFDEMRVSSDPVGELTRAYFGTIPDVFRRPNTGLYDWLGRRLRATGVRGILFWRHVFCDLWHAELPRIREATGLPVLDLDTTEGDAGSTPRMFSRVESFLEMLRESAIP